jgi:hypothetical protein
MKDPTNLASYPERFLFKHNIYEFKRNNAASNIKTNQRRIHNIAQTLNFVLAFIR